MSDEFDQKLRQAFPANTDAAVVRCLSSAVTLWSMDDLVATMDAVAPKPGPRGPYKKRS